MTMIMDSSEDSESLEHRDFITDVPLGQGMSNRGNNPFKNSMGESPGEIPYNTSMLGGELISPMPISSPDLDSSLKFSKFQSARAADRHRGSFKNSESSPSFKDSNIVQEEQEESPTRRPIRPSSKQTFTNEMLKILQDIGSPLINHRRTMKRGSFRGSIKKTDKLKLSFADQSPTRFSITKSRRSPTRL